MNQSNDRTIKNLVYAKFQFVSFFAYFLLIIAFLIVTLTDMFSYFSFGEKVTQGSTFQFAASKILSFQVKTFLGILSTLLVYSSMILIPASWLFGYQIAKDKNRTLTDSLFLLFVIVPFVSNLFALLAQISKNEYFVQNEKINYKNIMNQAVEEVRKEREVELDKLKNELIELTQEHNIALEKLVNTQKSKNKITKQKPKKKSEIEVINPE